MAETDYKIALEPKRDFPFTNGGTATIEIIKPAISTEPFTPPQSRPSAKVVGPAPSRPPPRLVSSETKHSTVSATHQKSALDEEPPAVQMMQQPKRPAPRPRTQQNQYVPSTKRTGTPPSRPPPRRPGTITEQQKRESFDLQRNPVYGLNTSELNTSSTITTPSSPAVVEVEPEPMSPRQKSPPPNTGKPQLQPKPATAPKPERLSHDTQKSLTPCKLLCCAVKITIITFKLYTIQSFL